MLDETDSGLDIDALQSVGAGINRIMRAPDKGVLLITHYQRLLDYVEPDRVHVLNAGRIVRSGRPRARPRARTRRLCGGGGVRRAAPSPSPLDGRGRLARSASGVRGRRDPLLAPSPSHGFAAGPSLSREGRGAMTAPFPTRKQEEWRYADLDALQPVWEQFAEPLTLTVGAGRELRRSLASGRRRRAGAPRADRARSAARRRGIFVLNTAPVYGRIELEVSLAEGADFELFGANIGTGLSTNEIVTNVRHVGVGGRSRQTIRSVLNGKAVGSYLGKVEVARGAQQTDAEQSVKAMLLDRGATANCKPELEIFADDVKCAHGATVGELDAMQLFYAESRGLDPASARALLLEGFVMGLWDSAKDAGDATRSREALRASALTEGCGVKRDAPALRINCGATSGTVASATSSRRSPAGIISTAPRPRRSRRR